MHSPALISRNVLDALVRAEAVHGEPDGQPDGGDDEPDGEDEDVDAGENEGDGAVLEGVVLLRDGELGGGVVGEDDVGGEDADEEDGFVEGDVGADAAVGGFGGQGERWEDEGLEVSAIEC